MMRAVISSSTLGTRTITGQPRQIAIAAESHLRDLAQAGTAFVSDVRGDYGDEKETAMLRAYLVGVERELKDDRKIAIKEKS